MLSASASGWSIVILVGLLVSTATPAVGASGEDRPPIVIESGDGFGIDTHLTDPGAPGQASAQPASDGGGVTCAYRPDTSNHSAGVPQWELDAPHTGEDGAWFFRQCSDGTFAPVWIPAAAGGPAVPRVTPGELAVQAVNYLPLPAPEVRHSPDRSQGRPQTVVGVRTWFWVAASSFTTLQQTTSAGGISATVTAAPVATEWTTGSADAPGMVCAGAGVPYDPSRDPSAQSTDCATTYSRSSAGQPQAGPGPNDRFFTGTATTVWRVSWVGSGGARGALPDLRRTSTFRLAVAEIQAVNQ
jgi:hypothetical protein